MNAAIAGDEVRLRTRNDWGAALVGGRDIAGACVAIGNDRRIATQVQSERTLGEDRRGGVHNPSDHLRASAGIATSIFSGPR